LSAFSLLQFYSLPGDTVNSKENLLTFRSVQKNIAVYLFIFGTYHFNWSATTFNFFIIMLLLTIFDSKLVKYLDTSLGRYEVVDRISHFLQKKKEKIVVPGDMIVDLNDKGVRIKKGTGLISQLVVE